MIDNQQVKYKISILFFRLVDRLPFLSPAFASGGGTKKRQPGRADFGEVVRPTYPTYSAYPNMSGVPTYSYVPIPHPLTT